jgi:hypothetical protein
MNIILGDLKQHYFLSCRFASIWIILNIERSFPLLHTVLCRQLQRFCKLNNFFKFLLIVPSFKHFVALAVIGFVVVTLLKPLSYPLCHNPQLLACFVNVFFLHFVTEPTFVHEKQNWHLQFLFVMLLSTFVVHSQTWFRFNHSVFTFCRSWPPKYV